MFSPAFVTFLLVTFLGIWSQETQCAVGIPKEDRQQEHSSSAPVIPTNDIQQDEKGILSRRGETWSSCFGGSKDCPKRPDYNHLPGDNSNTPIVKVQLVQRQGQAASIVHLGICDAWKSVQEVGEALFNRLEIPHFVNCYMPDKVTPLRRYLEMFKLAKPRVTNPGFQSKTDMIYCIIEKDNLQEAYPVSIYVCQHVLEGRFRQSTLAYYEYIGYHQS